MTWLYEIRVEGGWGVLKGIYPSDHTGARDQLHKGGALQYLFFILSNRLSMICLLGEINRFLQWKFTLALIHVHLLANITLTLNCTNFCTFTYPPIYHFHLLTNINFAFTCTLMALSLSLPKGPDHKIPVFYGFPNKCCAILPPFGRALISLSASY